MASLPITTVWNFQMLGGPGTNLQLAGWQAPFGRPRKGAVVDAGVKVRETRTDYPGNAVVPTIHAFGDQEKPWELHGRWMDQAIGSIGAAQAMVAQWKTFIKAHQIVRATWGPILSYQIFLHDFSAKYESSGEVAWTLTAHALVDETGPVTVAAETQPTPLDLASAMLTEMFPPGGVSPYDPASFGSLLGALQGFEASFAGALSALEQPFGILYQTCAALSSFESALSSDLAGLQASVNSVTTALSNSTALSDNMMAAAIALNTPSGTNPSPGATLTGSQMRNLCSAKVSQDGATVASLALLAQITKALQIAIRGTVSTAYAATAGDTWESIATTLLGTPDGARAIKNLNGIRYGQPPQAGAKYNIPQKFTAQGS